MRFDYFEPTSLDEAGALLREGGGARKPLAGGTDIVIQLRRRAAQCQGLVNLKRIPGLADWCCARDGGLHIGACTPMRDLETAAAVAGGYPSLFEAIRVVGSLQLRNIASVGGNLCNASPSADTAPPLMVLDAMASYRTDDGAEQSVPVEDFFAGPGASVLGNAGLLLSVDVPEPAPHSGDAFERFTPRSAMDIAIASAAAAVTLDTDGQRVEAVRIALGAVAPTPIRAVRAEELVREKEPTPELLQQAGNAAMEECNPIDDIRGTAAYRKELVRILVGRVLRRAVERARGDGGTETP
ncbi:MAG: xanthine dehydrogenase family protein subunit M [Deltaproteobacteria bacterium]|nr:xanthine dehydrogenase family protein subunit M [Deltaproteobacteria bacterium]MDE0213458.1 xanthine dehydrogenase family protein subunit M [Deltaproteobacteria bacterium]